MNLPPNFYSLHPYARAQYLMNTFQARSWPAAMRKAVQKRVKSTVAAPKISVEDYQKDLAKRGLD